MRVRVSYIIEADDALRRAIALYHGQEGLASRQDVKDFYLVHGLSMDDDLASLLDNEED